MRTQRTESVRVLGYGSYSAIKRPSFILTLKRYTVLLMRRAQQLQDGQPMVCSHLRKQAMSIAFTMTKRTPRISNNILSTESGGWRLQPTAKSAWSRQTGFFRRWRNSKELGPGKRLRELAVEQVEQVELLVQVVKLWVLRPWSETLMVF